MRRKTQRIAAEKAVAVTVGEEVKKIPKGQEHNQKD
jgi:hypothetical protein